MLKKLSLLFLTACLSACASNPLPYIPGFSSSNVDFSGLYLRGVFNWWEAQPAYQFTQSHSEWFVDVELIADGQPYDFKVSDLNWTPDQTCGARYKGQPVSTKEASFMICGADADTLQFTPSETGTYRFSLSNASSDELRLEINKL